MDRISALRNVEDALQAFEAGDQDLRGTQQQVLAILQTYATEFETAERRAYRAVGEEPADGTVVVATDADAARERICSLVDADSAAFDVDPL